MRCCDSSVDLCQCDVRRGYLLTELFANVCLGEGCDGFGRGVSVSLIAGSVELLSA